MKNLKIATSLIAALMLATVVGCASTSPAKHESAGQYVDDAAITTRVKKAIYDEPSLKVGDISVKTDDKVVQLSGTVKSRAEIRKAGEVAGKVEGVKRVKNDLQVK